MHVDDMPYRLCIWDLWPIPLKGVVPNRTIVINEDLAAAVSVYINTQVVDPHVIIRFIVPDSAQRIPSETKVDLVRVRGPRGRVWFRFATPGGGRPLKLYYPRGRNQFVSREQAGLTDRSHFSSKRQRMIQRVARIEKAIKRLQQQSKRISALMEEREKLNHAIYNQ